MSRRRVLSAGVATAVCIPVALSGIVAVLATRPKLAAKAFGGEPSQSKHPSQFGLNSTDVEYAPGCSAWWVPVDDAAGSVVIVHGFETSDDPKATDPGPRLELAAALCTEGFNCLVISLGYGSGFHLHSGGDLEADDIAAAVQWAQERGDVPVAVVGFSAGGHAAVAASSRMQVFGVVTDSSFVDFAEVVTDQGREVLPVPAWLLKPVPTMMRAATSRRPVNLESWPVDTATPMLHIHGDADQAIDIANLGRISARTGGGTLVVEGADHIESLLVDRERYVETVLSFLRDALTKSTP